MEHPAFRTFVERMDRLVTTETDGETLARGTAAHLEQLLRRPAFLPERFRVPGDDGYRQHLVHVGAEGRYSLVSLVWRPGQATPVHDHRCWCVVGVLQGREQEERYHLRADGADRWLVPERRATYRAGEVCWLVPPEEDIHVVRNAGEQETISLHVYGADIGVWGTSINHTFDLPVDAERRGDPVAWREVTEGATVTATGGPRP